MVQIAPSLLAADFARLGEALKFLKDAGASIVHLDVMDGHFVPKLTVGQPVVKSLRRATNLILDLHLQIERPEPYLKDFIDVGADRIAFHAEAEDNIHRALSLIRAGGCQAGLALNPATAVESVADILEGVDYLLLLSADLGFANPSFLPVAFNKIQAAWRLRREKKLNFAIQVEGCIGAEHIERLSKAGADILVADSDIFQKDSGTHRWLEFVRQAPPVARSRV